MKTILLAPNAFKGALIADHIADAMQIGFQQSQLDCHCILLPIADGGDGTLPIMAKYLGATIRQMNVHNTIGNEIEANWGWIEKEKTAIIELAEASGIRHLDAKSLNPWKTNTYGTGQLIKEAINQGASKIILTLGGSASIDGGHGLLEALDVKFFDENGKRLTKLNPGKLKDISRYEVPDILQKVAFEVLCDVTNPLVGPSGAAREFGPQKGAVDEDIPQLETGLSNLASVIKLQTGKEVKDLKHGGSAGGVAAAMNGILGAKLCSGAEKILEVSGFYQLLDQVDIVITGEGQIDRQTISGKGPGLVVMAAQNRGILTIGVAGSISGDITSLPGFDALFNINQGEEILEEAIKNTATNIQITCQEIGDLIYYGELGN